MSYNGWKNRETWAVHLWLTNAEGLYRMAKEAVSNDKPELSLELLVESLVEDALTPTLAGDLLWAALGRVDYGGITSALRER